MEINTQQLKELAIWLDGLYQGQGKLLVSSIEMSSNMNI